MGTKALFASEQSSNKMKRFVCRPAKIESACLSSTGEVTAGELLHVRDQSLMNRVSSYIESVSKKTKQTKPKNKEQKDSTTCATL